MKKLLITLFLLFIPITTFWNNQITIEYPTLWHIENIEKYEWTIIFAQNNIEYDLLLSNSTQISRAFCHFYWWHFVAWSNIWESHSWPATIWNSQFFWTKSTHITTIISSITCEMYPPENPLYSQFSWTWTYLEFAYQWNNWAYYLNKQTLIEVILWTAFIFLFLFTLIALTIKSFNSWRK